MTQISLTAELPLFDRLSAAQAAVRVQTQNAPAPAVGLILGSGLGDFADRLEDRVAIDYRDVPYFPVSTVHGHAGKLVLGRVGELRVVAMQGRAHTYEGNTLGQVTFPPRALVMLGARTLIITNAAGAVNRSYKPGDLVVLRDHLNFIGSPLIGPNDDRLGPRFPDLTQAYDPALRSIAREAGRDLGLDLAEGVYAASSGPQYETPSEVKMMGVLGADLVGMSTVPEVIVARHMGARVLGISCVTNMAAGISGEALSHDEVTETAARVKQTFAKLLEGILTRLSAGAEG
jgi:purine-nucleoside phosphorylase